MAFTAVVGSVEGMSSSMELHLGDPREGAALATIDLPEAPNKFDWAMVSAELSGQYTKKADLYLVLTGPARDQNIKLASN